MIDELFENIEAYLRMNDLGGMSDRMVLDYIRMSIAVYKEQQLKHNELKIQLEKSGAADAIQKTL